MPIEFHAQLLEALTPDATVLVTSAPLCTGGAGHELVVMSAAH
jgi:hypothetical protein